MSARPTMDFWNKNCPFKNALGLQPCRVSCSTRSHHPQGFHPATLIVITSSARSRYQTEIRPWVISVPFKYSRKGQHYTKAKTKKLLLNARCFFTNTKSSCGCWANNIHFINKNPSSDLICHDAMQFDVLKGIDFNAAGYMKICRGLIRQVVWYLQGSKGNFKERFWFYNPWCKFQLITILEGIMHIVTRNDIILLSKPNIFQLVYLFLSKKPVVTTTSPPKFHREPLYNSYSLTLHCLAPAWLSKGPRRALTTAGPKDRLGFKEQPSTWGDSVTTLPASAGWKTFRSKRSQGKRYLKKKEITWVKDTSGEDMWQFQGRYSNVIIFVFCTHTLPWSTVVIQVGYI